MLNKEELMTLHRHYMWTLVIKKHFETEVKKVSPNKSEISPENLFIRPYGAYMSIWYGMLFAILEVLRKNNVSIPKIQSDIDSVYGSLKMYRNAVFHPQKKYWSPKLIEIMKDKDSVRKIWNINSGLGEYFLNELDKLKNQK